MRAFDAAPAPGCYRWGRGERSKGHMVSTVARAYNGVQGQSLRPVGRQGTEPPEAESFEHLTSKCRCKICQNCLYFANSFESHRWLRKMGLLIG